MKSLTGFALLVLALSTGCRGEPPLERIEWALQSTEEVGGHPVVVLGEPRLISTSGGMALEFDGVDDGLQVAVHPLAGAREFTVEAVFLAAPDGPKEQRFLHLQEEGSDDRILLETRMTDNGRWFLDTHVETRGHGSSLYTARKTHSAGAWHHVALIVSDGRMRNFVDGVEEHDLKIDYKPQGSGRTSIGVRMNEVSWFKGIIRKVIFTNRAIEPRNFTRN